jgi:hypothetical protein
MTEKNYLINLNGGGDSQIVIVDEATWNWIHSPSLFVDATLGSYNEIVPSGVMTEHDEVRLSYSSFMNDRAMAAYCEDRYFYRMKDALAYIKENNIVIENEFSGGLY